MNKIKSTTVIVMFLFSVPATAQDNINFIEEVILYFFSTSAIVPVYLILELVNLSIF